jgi:hypothetical protein
MREVVKSSAPGSQDVAQAADKIDFLEFNDVEHALRDDLNFLKENPLVRRDSIITMWIYDDGTGKVCDLMNDPVMYQSITDKGSRSVRLSERIVICIWK